MKFPAEYSLKVDMTKVNWEVMKTWIAARVTEILGLEDEVVIGYIFEQLGPDKKVGQALTSRFSTCRLTQCVWTLVERLRIEQDNTARAAVRLQAWQPQVASSEVQT